MQQTFGQRNVGATSVEMPVTWSEELIRCVPTDASPTELTLPNANAVLGRRQAFHSDGSAAGLVYINPYEGQTINGSGDTQVLARAGSLHLQAVDRGGGSYGWVSI